MLLKGKEASIEFLHRYGLWIAVILIAVLPLWLCRYIPFQDLPQHLAAIRVLRNYNDPAYGFSRYFELALTQTQYLGYYLAVASLSYLMPLTAANTLAVSLCFAASFLALASLLGACGRERLWALGFLPFCYHTNVWLGFFNFIAAIPLMLWGIALTIRQIDTPKRWRGMILGLVSVLCFLMHLLPFVLLVFASLLLWICSWRKAQRSIPLYFVPSMLIAWVWSQRAPSSQSTFAILREMSPTHAGRATFQELPFWLGTSLFTTTLPTGWIALSVFLGCVGVGLAAIMHDRRGEGLHHYVLGIVAALCVLAYFVVPQGHGWVWPVAGRFPLLALLFLFVFLPPLKPPWMYGFFSALLVSGVLTVFQIHHIFQRFNKLEVGAYDHILRSIPPRQRVAGLIFDRPSAYAPFAPFIHFPAYYMVERGGAAVFSFALFPNSPYRFRKELRLPHFWPRWEWTPEQVDPANTLSWFNYVITRGGPGIIAEQNACYLCLREEGPWRLWKRIGTQGCDVL